MTQLSKKTFSFTLIFFLACILLGCSPEIRHINSDVCLIQHGNSAKNVMEILGPPNIRKQTETGELWTYYSAQKSPLKRTPGVNLMFGTVTYDVIHVTFANNIVTNCQYRYANEAEFKQAKLDSEKEE